MKNNGKHGNDVKFYLIISAYTMGVNIVFLSFFIILQFIEQGRISLYLTLEILTLRRSIFPIYFYLMAVCSLGFAIYAVLLMVNNSIGRKRKWRKADVAICIINIYYGNDINHITDERNP